jgi:hypothetical protein
MSQGEAVYATLVDLGNAYLEASAPDMAAELEAVRSMLNSLVSQVARPIVVCGHH